MSVYAGIDVHRKRSQVAVVGSEETVALNRNVVDGKEPVLKLIGGLPAGTPVAVEAAFGWGWLADLLENYGFEAHLVQPSAVQGDRFGQAEERQGRCGDLGAVAAGGSAARGLDRVSGGAPVAGAAAPPGQPGAAVHPSCATGSTPWWPTSVTTGLELTGPGRAAAGWRVRRAWSADKPLIYQ